MDEFFRRLRAEYRKYITDDHFFTRDAEVFKLYKAAIISLGGGSPYLHRNHIDMNIEMFGAEAIYQAVLKERLK